MHTLVITIQTLPKFYPPSPEASSGVFLQFDSVITCSIKNYSQGLNHLSSFPSGVSICGVCEWIERSLSWLPHRQQPDPNWAQDNRHGGDGGGISGEEKTSAAITQGLAGLVLDVRITVANGRVNPQDTLFLSSSIVWTRCVTYRPSVLKNVGVQAVLMIPSVARTHRWHVFPFEFRIAHRKELILQLQLLHCSHRDAVSKKNCIINLLRNLMSV